MKRFILILMSMLAGNLWAQDSDLFQTWYIDHIRSELFGAIPIFSSDVTPEITPTMTFISVSDSEIIVNGFSGCNNFTVTYTYLPDTPLDFLEPIAFETESNVCSDSIMLWESQWYTLLYPNTAFYYVVTDTTDGQNLEFGTPLHDAMVGQNYGLATPSFEASSLEVFPNPTTETLRWTNITNTPFTVRIYSTQGKLVMSEVNAINSIDVASLPSGLYFVELQDRNKLSRTKFIKQ
ncbi:MAG: T9SS type A sorting domain-containing protein [Gilvibacter sp.]